MNHDHQTPEFLEFARKIYDLSEKTNNSITINKTPVKISQNQNHSSQTKVSTNLNQELLWQTEKTNASLELLKEQQCRQYVFLSSQMTNISAIQKKLDSMESTLEQLGRLESKIDNSLLNKSHSKHQVSNDHNERLNCTLDKLNSVDLTKINDLIDRQSKGEETQELYQQKIDLLAEKMDRLIDQNTNCIQTLQENQNDQLSSKHSSGKTEKQMVPRATQMLKDTQKRINFQTLEVVDNSDYKQREDANYHTIKVVDEQTNQYYVGEGEQDEQDDDNRIHATQATHQLHPMRQTNNLHQDDTRDLLQDFHEKFCSLSNKIDSIDASQKLSNKNECDQIISQKLNLLNENLFKIQKQIKNKHSEEQHILGNLENKLCENMKDMGCLKESLNANNFTFNNVESDNIEGLQEFKDLILNSLKDIQHNTNNIVQETLENKKISNQIDQKLKEQQELVNNNNQNQSAVPEWASNLEILINDLKISFDEKLQNSEFPQLKKFLETVILNIIDKLENVKVSLNTLKSVNDRELDSQKSNNSEHLTLIPVKNEQDFSKPEDSGLRDFSQLNTNNIRSAHHKSTLEDNYSILNLINNHHQSMGEQIMSLKEELVGISTQLTSIMSNIDLKTSSDLQSTKNTSNNEPKVVRQDYAFESSRKHLNSHSFLLKSDNNSEKLVNSTGKQHSFDVQPKSADSRNQKNQPRVDSQIDESISMIKSIFRKDESSGVSMDKLFDLISSLTDNLSRVFDVLKETNFAKLKDLIQIMQDKFQKLQNENDENSVNFENNGIGSIQEEENGRSFPQSQEKENLEMSFAEEEEKSRDQSPLINQSRFDLDKDGISRETPMSGIHPSTGSRQDIEPKETAKFEMQPQEFDSSDEFEIKHTHIDSIKDFVNDTEFI